MAVIGDMEKLTIGSNTYTIADAQARSDLDGKQDALVSGTNIKTINGESILGSGDITVGATAMTDEEVNAAIDQSVQTMFDEAIDGGGSN